MAGWFDKKPDNPFLGLGGMNALQKNTLTDLVSGVAPPRQPSLADLVSALAPPPSPLSQDHVSGLLGVAAPLSSGIFGSPAPPPPPPHDSHAAGLLNLLAPQPSGIFGSLAPPPPLPIKPLPAARPAPVKRKAFFSFHFDDLLRVNNVRNAWKIGHPDRPFMRNFYDRSLWESKKRESDDALKSLIRAGMEHSSAVCVLIGTGTWARRWVKYEIARSVVDGRGLLAVHINGLNHHHRRQPDPLGYNPMHLMGVFQASTGKFYLYEKRHVVINYLTNQTEWQWHPYKDYTQSVCLPRYLKKPDTGYIMPLASAVDEYDYVAGVGHKNLGMWIDRAAIRAGR
jgi:Thoeris protein ThsB, TIR-like domain